ncbi:hypothetical protein BABINDRAFT_41201 [Babjeviella inositovora NRRL Y-12698]|uniref:ABC transporter domain-containing protein n=1 Tax=Babjeviella inositovora NRRL Y-12698 TaxID=984486 RepID=A0A1E3QKP4_9ASCO|nr:uncharacterized protein BABINDRAFT_41201 [Babjeviella inositovora NRRL Y-12698]ODQ77567.1 hypothetical protein BABINDRAFT_41201 [Babjeviella inositovora NRRL Y-12698]
MINISTLYEKRQELIFVVKEFIKYVKENKKIDYRSKHVVIFLATVLSTGVVGVVYAVQKLINDMRERQANRRYTFKRRSSAIIKSGARAIYIPRGNKEVRIAIPRPNMDVYEADKFKFKNFQKDLKLYEKSSIFNSRFLRQIIIIWQILIPRVFHRNSYFLATQCFFLVLRTWLSLMIAKLDGQIVKDIIGGKGRSFIRDLVYWFAIAFPASYTNAAIKFLTSRLSINFRTNLMRYIHDLYMDKSMIYYKLDLNNSDLTNIDQYITNDVTKFCDSICDLFTSMGKPMMDLIFFSIYLRDNLGTAGIVGLFANYFLTGYVLKRNTPAFGKLSKQRTELEGDYYNAHLNLITNCEEIAFYKGSLLEKMRINKIFLQVTKHSEKEHAVKVPYSALEDYILKYTWSALGYLFASIPIFMDELFVPESKKSSKKHQVNEEKNMRQFIVNKRLMLNMADAGSRLMYSIKDISELTGYTDRVFSLLSNLHQVHSRDFQYGNKLENDINGTIQTNYHGLRVEKLPVIIPSSEGSEGVQLIEELSFQIKESQNLLILATNGVGKTSIGRIIAGLWPIYRGLLSKPDDSDIYYLPQKTYFSSGTLRDQVIYPFSHAEMLGMGYTDEHLYRVLRDVKLEYLLDREGGWEVKKDWKDVFSGGEKQRMSLARVVFKRPQFVVLDESTNAVSSDVEDYLFEMLQKKKITFITLSHRPLLIKYHDYLLDIQPDGQWEFVTLGTDEGISSVEKEIHEIETKLSEVAAWTSRKEVVEAYLDGKTEPSILIESASS